MWRIAIMLQKLKTLIILLHISTVCLSQDDPEVETPLGKIRGFWKTSHDGKKYAAFEGIPYAKPPIGNLRFEEPQPVEPWIGTWDATSPHTCLQTSFTLDTDLVLGEEDCLYLNVYVPKDIIGTTKTLDGLVCIHGGAFMVSSAHEMTNDTIIMDRDVLLVSVNYRLNIFGFLSTEDDVISGNNGMKDQVLALKWVKENIASFGGDPKSVTIAGLSAGGASVHLHYFSPMSKGLFIRGISQSGTALNPWVIKENPLEHTKKLAALVGCPVMCNIELKKCLQQRPAQVLVEKLKNFSGFGIMPFSPFAPVIEKSSKNPFLSDEPYFLLKSNKVLDLPWITSTTTHEGFLPIKVHYHELDRINEEWLETAHLLLDYNYTVPISNRRQIAKRIKDFYLGLDQDIREENFEKLTKIFTDRLFTIAAENAAKLQSKAVISPVYYYLFNYADGANKAATFPSKEIVEGVSHGEDCTYFYGFFMTTPFSENDKKMKELCQNMLHSFVKTGKPSFDDAIKWLPTKDSELVYLNVTNVDDIKLQSVDSLVPNEFWTQLGINENENVVTSKDEL